MKKSETYTMQVQLDIKPLFDVVKIVQGMHCKIPRIQPVYRAMTHDEMRAEAAVFMQKGGTAGGDLDGLVTLIRSNNIDVETYEDIEYLEGKQKAECLRRADPDGLSVFAPEIGGHMILINNREPYFKNIFTCAHEAAHCYLEHHRARSSLPTDLQEREANFAANCLSSRQGFRMIAEALKTKEPCKLDYLGACSMFCALNALKDENGKYSFSPNTLWMVSAAIESVQKP